MTTVHVFDTETASLEGGVCDIAIVEINDDFEVVSAIESLIDPERPISPAAMGIHQITNEMVADAPTLSEFVGVHGNPFSKPGLVVAGHSVAFDIRMVAAIMPEEYQKICTLKLARTLYPGLENHQLQTIRFAFGLQAGPAHRAMGDVITCISFVRHICRTKNWSLAQLVEASNQPLSLDTKLGWGKHKGTKIRDLPHSYMAWALREMASLDPEMRTAFKAVLNA